MTRYNRHCRSVPSVGGLSAVEENHLTSAVQIPVFRRFVLFGGEADGRGGGGANSDRDERCSLPILASDCTSYVGVSTAFSPSRAFLLDRFCPSLIALAAVVSLSDIEPGFSSHMPCLQCTRCCHARDTPLFLRVDVHNRLACRAHSIL